MKLCRLLAPVLFVGVFAPAAKACPLCHTQTACEIRSDLAADVTPKTVAAVAAPFVVIAGVVSLVHFGLPNFRRKP